MNDQEPSPDSFPPRPPTPYTSSSRPLLAMDSHVTISPADGLPVLAPSFPPNADEYESAIIHSAMTIENHSDDNVLFKMKINFNKAYCTLKPTVGYLRPGESSEVLVTLKIQPSFSCEFPALYDSHFLTAATASCSISYLSSFSFPTSPKKFFTL